MFSTKGSIYYTAPLLLMSVFLTAILAHDDDLFVPKEELDFEFQTWKVFIASIIQ